MPTTIRQRAHRQRVMAALDDWAGVRSDAWIGSRLGLSARTVANWRWRLHVRRIDRWGWYTTGQAARLTGLSPGTLATMARSGRIRARRLVAGHGYRRGWWLLDPRDVERISRERQPAIWQAWKAGQPWNR